MTGDAARALAAEIAVAHNAARLRSAAALRVHFSSGGLAFAAKGQPSALREVDAQFSPTEQQIVLTGGQPRRWTVTVPSGTELGRGLRRLRRGRRQLRWQPEDAGLFAAAALWTYLTIPLLLERSPRLERLRDRSGNRRLRVQLPADVAGHAAVQTLHVTKDGLIARHDYTATAFGRWARAGQRVGDYRCFDEIPIGTSRHVTPRVGARWPAPELVWITIHDVRLDAAVD